MIPKISSMIPPKEFERKDYFWRKIEERDEKEMKRLEKAQERYEKRKDRNDAKELKRYEKALDKRLDSDKNWL